MQRFMSCMKLSYFCVVALSPRQLAYVEQPELHDSASLLTLAELEANYGDYKFEPLRWRHLIADNPGSSFLLYRYSLVAKNEERDDSLTYLTESLKGAGANDLLRFLQAEEYYSRSEYQQAAPRFLELFADDFRNITIYEPLERSLSALELGEQAVLQTCSPSMPSTHRTTRKPSASST